MAEKKNKAANIDVLGNIYNNILKGLSLGKTLIMLQGGGRCFAAGTKIRMYDGSLKNIEDIAVGDKVMNADGHSFSNVTETHSGIGQLYRIHPKKSECDYLVNGEHILTLKQTEAFSKKIDGKHVRVPFDRDKIIDISVKEFIIKPKEWRGVFSLFKCRTNEQKDEFTTHFTITKDEVGRYYGFTLDKSPYFMDYQGFVFHNSGKTYNTMIFLVLQCLNSIKKVSIVRQSLPVIKRSVLEDFKTIMRQMGQWDDRRFNKTDCIYYFPNGSVMEFFSAEDEQKLRGPSRDILYANEANEISYYAFSNLRMRTYGYCIVDYNPSFTEEHWLFPLMTDERTYFFKSTFKDNIFLPQAARDEIMSYKETNPALWKIYGEGEFAIIDGLVFPKENWDIIPDEEFPTWLGEEYLGIDWGFVSDPTVCVGAIVNDTDIYVREYFRETGLKTKDIAQRLEPYRDRYKYCDIDNRLVSELEDAGIPLLTMTRKNGESIMTGIRLMNQRHIHITASSTDTIKEFRNYVYKKDRHETYQTNLRPIDKFNHCFTGDTLIKTSVGDVRIDNIDVGDIVFTSNGLQKVMKVFHNGMQEVWDILLTTYSGVDIRLSVTPTHKVKTKQGWKQIQNVAKGDVIYLFNYLTERNTTCTKEKGIFHEEVKDYTLQCGNFITAEYPMGIISTIKMKTHGIIRLITSNCLKLTSIYHSMRKNIKSKVEQWKNYEKEWTMQESMPESGIKANKVKSGINSMQKNRLQKWKKKNMFAKIVGYITDESHWEQTSFVATTANQHGEEKCTLTTKFAFVKNAKENLVSTSTAKQSVAAEHVLKDIQIIKKHNAETFNLMIDTTHEYFANGLLVSNCIDALRYIVYAECSGCTNDDTRGFSKEELGIFM